MEYEAVIGVETHAQLLTASKMFCGCSSDYAQVAPNSLVCPVCLGMPGALPVINRRAVECVIITGLALHCEIAEFSKFDRKNYNYPDLAKGYQISQYDLPICRNGWIDILTDNTTKRIGIQRVHLEEDTGKLTHIGGQSLIDYNRSGVPLMEIVTAPDFSRAEEVQEYARNLRTILRYLHVNSGSMEEGALRIEVNVSIRPVGVATKGPLVELKNLNSFRAIGRSVEYEIARQEQVARAGNSVRRDTRGWDDSREVTFAQRSKESADDYRYFPEPDLPPLQIPRDWVDEIRASMPELPEARRQRFVTQYGLSAYDAGLLTEEQAVADYFEQAVSVGAPEALSAKTIANWVTGELFHLLNLAHVGIEAVRIPPTHLVGLLTLVAHNAINTTTGRQVLETMFETGRSAHDIVVEDGLAQITDEHALATVMDQVLRENPGAVTQYVQGKESVLRFLVGQVMRATKGKADPNRAAEALRERLRGTGA